MLMKQPFQGRVISTQKIETLIIFRKNAGYLHQKERILSTDCQK